MDLLLVQVMPVSSVPLCCFARLFCPRELPSPRRTPLIFAVIAAKAWGYVTERLLLFFYTAGAAILPQDMLAGTASCTPKEVCLSI